eukprot:1126465-Amorphochlora_amoeboformis.AAC.2
MDNQIPPKKLQIKHIMAPSSQGESRNALPHPHTSISTLTVVYDVFKPYQKCARGILTPVANISANLCVKGDIEANCFVVKSFHVGSDIENKLAAVNREATKSMVGA